MTDIDALRAFKGPGRHLTRYFLMTETDYMSESNERLVLKFKQFSYLMKGLGISNELIGRDDTSSDAMENSALHMIYPQDQRFGIRQMRNFDGAVYLSLNEDIRSSGMPPLDHYLSFGYREGRPVEHATQPFRANAS